MVELCLVSVIKECVFVSRETLGLLVKRTHARCCTTIGLLGRTSSNSNPWTTYGEKAIPFSVVKIPSTVLFVTFGINLVIQGVFWREDWSLLLVAWVLYVHTHLPVRCWSHRLHLRSGFAQKRHSRVSDHHLAFLNFTSTQ